MVEDHALSKALAFWTLENVRKRYFPKEHAAFNRVVAARVKLESQRPDVPTERDLEVMEPGRRDRVKDDIYAYAESRERLNIDTADIAAEGAHALRRAASRPSVFTAYARPGAPTAELQQIPIDFLASLKSIEWGTSTVVVGRPEDELRLYSVRLVPALLAPDAGDVLEGSLDQIVAAHVWGAPEIVAVASNAAGVVGQHVHGPGVVVVPFADDRHAVRGSLLQALAGAFPGDAQMTVVVDIATDRLARLFSLVLSGALQLAGRSASGEAIEPIPSAFWRAADLSLSLASFTIHVAGATAWRDVRVWPRVVADASLGREAIHRDDSKGGRPVEEKRLEILDRILAELLSQRDPIFPRQKDFDQRCAQAWLDSNLNIGNDRRGRDVPKGTIASETQIERAGEWIVARLPETRKALAGKWKAA